MAARRRPGVPFPKVPMRPLLVCSLLLLAPFASASQNTWIVDDDGWPADFIDIGDAVAAAADGDTILVMDGEYSNAKIQKRLTLIGDPSAPVRPFIERIDVLSAPGCDLVNLRLDDLGVQTTAGRVRVENCRIQRGTHLSGAAEFYASRCEFRGANASPSGQSAISAQGFHHNAIHLVDCDLVGGSSTVPIGGVGLGGYGLIVTIGEARLFGCTVRAGSGLTPGTGIFVGNGASLDFRGNASNTILGGEVAGGPPGPGVVVQLMGHAVVSGTTPTGVGPVEFTAPRPFLMWRGVAGPGSGRVLQQYGESGHVAVAFHGAPGFDPTTYATLGVWLGVDPNALLFSTATTLAGYDTPAGPALFTPNDPTLAGTVLATQAAVIDPATGASTLTNSDEFVLSF